MSTLTISSMIIYRLQRCNCARRITGKGTQVLDPTPTCISMTRAIPDMDNVQSLSKLDRTGYRTHWLLKTV